MFSGHMWRMKSCQWVATGAFVWTAARAAVDARAESLEQVADLRDDVDGGQPDKERQRCNYLKINKAFDADAADSLQVPMTRDSCHQCGKDQGSHNGLDQSQEDVTEDTELDRKARRIYRSRHLS